MKKFFSPRLIVTFATILTNTYLISSLDCVYCPSYSTEDECNRMNMTQICINETKCGYAKFIEKRDDMENLYPEQYDKKNLTVTVKKGCMDEDFCIRVQKSEKFANVIVSDCIFCDEDLCTLQYPRLCVECNEAVDEYCAIKTEPIVTCGPEEVCYGQRNQWADYYLKRGCMKPSLCLKKDFCQHCNSDLCRMDPLPPYPLERRKSGRRKEEKHVYNHGNISNPLRDDLVVYVIFAMCSMTPILFNDLFRII